MNTKEIIEGLSKEHEKEWEKLKAKTKPRVLDAIALFVKNWQKKNPYDLSYNTGLDKLLINNYWFEFDAEEWAVHRDFYFKGLDKDGSKLDGYDKNHFNKIKVEIESHGIDWINLDSKIVKGINDFFCWGEDVAHVFCVYDDFYHFPLKRP